MKQGWQIKKLGEVCRFQNGFAFKSNLFTKTGEPIIRISDIQNEEVCEDNLVCFNLNSYKEDLSRFIVYPNDILIAMSGGTTGKLGINRTGRRFYLNQRVGVFREDKNVLDHHYLFYYLHTKSDESLRIAAGAAQPNLSTAQINAFEIPLPPLSEQQRIVALLDAEFAKIDALKANAEKNLQNAKDLFQAALKKELEPKEGWKKDFLSKIAYISRGRSQHRPRNEASLYGGDYPFIQTGDIRDANGGTISTFNQTYSEIGLQQSKLWKKGTICITIAANIGETAILGMDACFPDSVVGIIPNNQIVCTDFLNYCLTKEKDELNEIAHGTAQKNINVAILEKVLITYPIEISIQQSIVARLDALNEKCKTLQANYKKTLSLCDDLKQALLRKAFNGEI